MCEPLGVFKPLIIFQVQLSLNVVQFKCNFSVNRFAFKIVIKRRLESQSARGNKGLDKHDNKTHVGKQNPLTLTRHFVCFNIHLQK